jgi:beta-phosphoglucomutase
MLKGVVFDLDGVLIDTEYFQWQGWVEALKSFDVSMSKDDYHHYAGIRGDIIESKLIEKYNLDVEKGLLLAKKEKLLMEWFKSKPPALMPYAKESVQFFIDRNFRVAVASTAPEDEVLLKLKGTSLYS